jgi:hypothetical protein
VESGVSEEEALLALHSLDCFSSLCIMDKSFKVLDVISQKLPSSAFAEVRLAKKITTCARNVVVF